MSARPFPMGLALAWLSFALPLAAAKERPLVATVVVEGISCPFCVKGLEKKLRALSFVADVRIDHRSGRADLDVKEGEVPDLAAVTGAVQKAGFTSKETSLSARGVLVGRKSGVHLELEGGGSVTLVLPPGDEALREAANRRQRVELRGPATTTEGRTAVTVVHYKLL